MANKFYGPIGYAISSETAPGVWTDTIVERNYYGDVLKNYERQTSGHSTNDDVEVNNRLSIVSDPFAIAHFHTIKYVKWLGAAWKITSAEVQYPRLILTIGGVYNGETAATA